MRYLAMHNVNAKGYMAGGSRV